MSKQKEVEKGFDLRVRKPNFFWNAVIRVASPFQLLPVGGKITKVNCKGLKPPYLVLSNHGSMIDFPMLLKATFPHTINWVVAIDGYVARGKIPYNIGMICKRKFTNEISTARNMLRILTKEKGIVALYPEARWSICGVNERIDGAIGKLVKLAKCPVVIFIEQGNFLYNPQWDVAHKRKVKVSATMTQLVTREEAETLSAAEIQKRIEDFFVFDQYKWQYDNKVAVTSVYRANNLHKVLYQCPHCKTEFSMKSKETEIWCEKCGKVWEMDIYGRLHSDGGDIFSHVPDWYRWERANVREEVRSGGYRFEDDARIELIHSSELGWVDQGVVRLTIGYDGVTIEGNVDGKYVKFNRAPEEAYSAHIEYDFQGRGDCIEFCAPEDTYYVYPLSKENFNCATKMHLAVEELHDFVLEQRKKGGS